MNLVEYFLSKVVVCSWSKDMETLPGRYLLLCLFNKFTIPNYSESKIVKFPGRLSLCNDAILSLYGKIRFRKKPYSDIFYTVRKRIF